MSEQDLEQIRQIFAASTAELKASQERAFESLKTEIGSLKTDVGSRKAEVESLKVSQERAVESLRASQERAVESLIGNISDLRTEINQRFNRVDQRLDSVERHLERMDTRLSTTAIELTALNRAQDSNDRMERQILATQEAQQKAIDHLYVEL